MNVAIIKYNAGNIFSIDYALRRLGIEPVITADKERRSLPPTRNLSEKRIKSSFRALEKPRTPWNTFRNISWTG